MTKVGALVALCVCVCATDRGVQAREQGLYRIKERVTTPVRPAHAGGRVEQEIRGAINARVQRRRAELERDPARTFAGLEIRGERPGQLVTTKRRLVARGSRVVCQVGSQGAAYVETLFVATEAAAPKGATVEHVAEQVALVIHHTDDRGRDVVVSLPIHITLDELTTLATDPAQAAKTELGRLIRAVQQESHQVATHSTLRIHALDANGRVGEEVGRLPTSLLDLEAIDVLAVEQTGEQLTARRLQREAERASRLSQAAGKGSTQRKGAASLLTSAGAH